MKLLLVDIETTGLNCKENTIKEIGGIIKIDGKIKERFLFKSNIYKNFINILDKYVDRFNKEDKFYFLAYNAGFDSDFIRTLFLRNGNNYYGSYFFNPYIDVLQVVAHKLMGKKKQPENFKLFTIAKFFGIPCRESMFHHADYDIRITNEIYKKVKGGV